MWNGTIQEREEMMGIKQKYGKVPIFLLCLCLIFAWSGCAATSGLYRDPNMDFGLLQSVAVMPLENLTREQAGAGRVRDIFITKLLSTGAVYVVPAGEVARGISRAGIVNPSVPSPDEIVKLAGIIKVDAVFTGVVREYGEVRSGSTSANVIAISMQMSEAQTGKVVWSADATEGGVTAGDRLFGGGGKPMNDISDKAIDDLLKKLFQ